MALKETWRPRIDGVDDADSSAVNEIAAAVIELEKNSMVTADKIVDGAVTIKKLADEVKVIINEAEETAKRAEITADEAKAAVECLNVGLTVVDGKLNITFEEDI